MVYKFWKDRSHGENVMYPELANMILNNTNYVTTGCGVTFNATMDIDIASGTIHIGGSDVSVTGTTETITNGDASHPRVDLVRVNSSGVISVLAGTPSSAPVSADYTEIDYVVIGIIYVPASATTITSSEVEDIGMVNANASGATTFLALTDTPATFTADKWLKANAGGTALEWTTAPTTGTVTSVKATFTSQTSLAINHALNDDTPIVQVYDNLNKQVTPDDIEIIDANNVTITFATATTGRYVIHGE